MRAERRYLRIDLTVVGWVRSDAQQAPSVELAVAKQNVLDVRGILSAVVAVRRGDACTDVGRADGEEVAAHLLPHGAAGRTASVHRRAAEIARRRLEVPELVARLPRPSAGRIGTAIIRQRRVTQKLVEALDAV